MNYLVNSGSYINYSSYNKSSIPTKSYNDDYAKMNCVTTKLHEKMVTTRKHQEKK